MLNWGCVLYYNGSYPQLIYFYHIWFYGVVKKKQSICCIVIYFICLLKSIPIHSVPNSNKCRNYDNNVLYYLRLFSGDIRYIRSSQIIENKKRGCNLIGANLWQKPVH